MIDPGAPQGDERRHDAAIVPALRRDAAEAMDACLHPELTCSRPLAGGPTSAGKVVSKRSAGKRSSGNLPPGWTPARALDGGSMLDVS